MKKTYKIKKSYLNNYIIDIYENDELIVSEAITEEYLIGYVKCLETLNYSNVDPIYEEEI